MSVFRAARHDLCPARALGDWLRASVTRYGPVFRKATRWGTVEPAVLNPDAVRRIFLAAFRVTARDPARAARRAADTLARWLEDRARSAVGRLSFCPPAMVKHLCRRLFSRRPAHPTRFGTGLDNGASGRAGTHDLLYHYLTVTGPTPDLDAFRRGAAGAGSVPWTLTSTAWRTISS